MSAVEQLITVSRMKAFNACRRLHHYQYVLGYRPLIDRSAADFGTIMHAGLEAWWLAYAAGQVSQAAMLADEAICAASMRAEVDISVLVRASLLMAGYHARWAPTMDEWEVVAVEREFSAPLPAPIGAVRPAGLRVAGKIDVLVRRRSDGTVWIVEHKTTAADLSPGSTYWQRLRMDTQVSVYFRGAAVLGFEPVGCLYDVLSRPEHKLLKATPPDKRKYTKGGQLYAAQRAEDETLDAFRTRVATEIAAYPENYFQRAEVVRLAVELEDSERDTYDTAMMIVETEAAARAPRNPDACFLYGRPCSFYDVCSGAASLDDDSKFRRLDSVHPELLAVTATV